MQRKFQLVDGVLKYSTTIKPGQEVYRGVESVCSYRGEKQNPGKLPCMEDWMVRLTASGGDVIKLYEAGPGAIPKPPHQLF